MDVCARLTRNDWPKRLGLLGVEPVDHEPIIAMIGQVLEDEAALARVQRYGDDLLVARLGDWRDVFGREGFPEIELLNPLMASALPLCALLATVDDVRAFHAAHGVPDAISWASVADVGQQVTKHRLVTGRTGLTQSNWLRNVWVGTFMRLGRLQFELHRTQLPEGERTVLNAHIPAGGSMTPQAVDESLVAAAPFFERHFGDHFDGSLEWVVCSSWLLDRQLLQLVPGSNVADFADRWEAIGGEPKDRDGYYFVFNIEPLPGTTLPFRLDELPQNSSLERALARLWREGGHVQQVKGRIPAGRTRAGQGS